MHKIICLLCSLLIFQPRSSCQNHWEAYIGLNHSNIIHKNGEQLLYNHTLNSPLWNYGFQLGVTRALQIKRNFLTFGIRVQLKGDRKSLNEVYPNFAYYGLRLIDLMSPINFKLRLLESKNIFLQTGVSCNYLVYQKKVGGIKFFPIYSFVEKLGVSAQIGFNFRIKNKISAELMYSQGLTNIYSIPEFSTDPSYSSETTYKHQSFELTFMYIL